MQSETINELAAALAKAQGEMKAATFNKINPAYKSKYADLAAIIDAVRPALSKNGLSVTQTTRMTEGALMLETTLLHISGQWIKSEWPLPAGKPQEMGSATTYAKRYTLSAICCIAADEDDDANAAEDAGQKAAKPNPVTPAKIEALQANRPGLIPVPVAADGQAPDWIAWGGKLVATLKGCTTPEQVAAWLKANDAPLKNLRAGPEKIAKRVDTVIKECLAATSQAPVEAA